LVGQVNTLAVHILKIGSESHTLLFAVDLRLNMIRLLILSVFCVSASLAAPYYNETEEAEYWWDWDDLPGWETYHRYVPKNVKTFLNKTFIDGLELVYDLQEDIEAEVEKTDENINDFIDFYHDMVNEIDEIRQLELDVGYTGPLSEQELNERNAALEETKIKLRGLADKVEDEMRKEEKDEEGLKKAIQTFITFVRSVVSEDVVEGHDWLWTKLTHLEGASYKTLDFVADASERLKYLVNDLFDKLAKVDLMNIGDEDNLEPATEEEPVNVPRSKGT